VYDTGTKKKTCMAKIDLTMHIEKMLKVNSTLRFPAATTAYSSFGSLKPT